MRYLLKRLVEGLAVVWAVATIAFFALRLGRVDPLASLLAQGLATRTQVEEMRVSLGLDRPLGSQYAEYVRGALRGDLGRSIFTGQSVAAMTAEAIGYTSPLALAAWLISMLAGMGLGILSSHRGEPGWLGGAGAVTGALLAAGASTPVAWSGLVLLWISIPVVAAAPAGLWNEALRLLLPAGALAVTIGGSIGRATETSIRQARGELFHLAMRAHGFPRGARADWRLLRAVIAPLLALSGLEAAFLLGGTMVTEVVFARPGLGRLLADAVLHGDYPVVQAVLPLAALGYMFFGIIADLSSAALDPRLHEAG
jgi:peptide/nickel transport system permease protein